MLPAATTRPVNLLLEVGEAAKCFGGGQIVTSYSCGDSIKRNVETTFGLCPGYGVSTQRCVLRARNGTYCDMELHVSNLSHENVLLGFGTQRILLRSKEHRLTLLLARQRQPLLATSCDTGYLQSVLEQIQWRIDGSKNGHLDGYGSLAGATCHVCSAQDA